MGFWNDVWNYVTNYAKRKFDETVYEVQNAKYTVDFGVKNGIGLGMKTPKGWSLDLILEQTPIQPTQTPAQAVPGTAQTPNVQTTPQTEYKVSSIDVMVGGFNYHWKR